VLVKGSVIVLGGCVVVVGSGLFLLLVVVGFVVCGVDVVGVYEVVFFMVWFRYLVVMGW